MDVDLEKCEPASDSITSTTSLADDEDDPIPCSCGSDGPDYSCRRHYTYGLTQSVFLGMILVSLLFTVLAVILLRRNPAPATAEEAGKVPNTTAVVWKVSLLLYSYLFFWIVALSRTTGAASAFFRLSYGALLAFAGGALVGPNAGVAVAHLHTAWAAGLVGHALAEHRVRVGFELAAGEAAARTPARWSSNDELGICYSVFMSGLVTLFLVAGVAAWMAFLPTFRDEDGDFVVASLSFVVCVGLLFWAMLANHFLLRDALVPVEFTLRLGKYYMAASVPSFVCALVSQWLWAYCFGMEMMAMAAFFGYTLGVNACCKEILAREGREQPSVIGDEPGTDQDKAPASVRDQDNEPASAASTGDEDAEAQRCHLEEHCPLITDHIASPQKPPCRLDVSCATTTGIA
ncbi:hypothetical protein EJB05_28704, partial [Eragrostis curvula]